MLRKWNRLLSGMLCIAFLLSMSATAVEDSVQSVSAAQTDQTDPDLQQLHIQDVEASEETLPAESTEPEPVEEIAGGLISMQLLAEMEPAGEPNEEVTLAFARSSMTIGKGDSYDLHEILQLQPADSDVQLTFSSSKPSYVSVSEDGIIKGRKNGSANITVKAPNGASAKIKITVKILATSKRMSFSPKKLTLGIHNTGTLKVKFSSGYAGLYMLASSDPSVAEVDQNGNVIAKGIGTATITASLAQKPSVSKSITVTVYAAPQKILASREMMMLSVGQKSSAVCGINPDPKNSHCGFTYVSSDPDVVRVDPVTGELSAIAMGKAEIIVTADNNPEASAKCAVTVIELQTANRIVGVGDSYDLHDLILHPDGESAGEYSFSSSKKSVATVSADGIIKGKKAGIANITIKSAEGLSVKVKVTVRKYATSGKIKLTPAELILGEEMNGKFTVKFSSGYYGLYKLSSSDEDIVQVEADGTLRAISPGEAEITLQMHKSSATKKASVRVLPAPEKIEATVSELTLGIGQASAALAGVNPDPENSMCAFCYESSDASVAAVDPVTGEITALQTGSAQIFLRASNNPEAVANCMVTVVPGPESIAFEGVRTSVGVKEKYQLSCVLLPEGSAGSLKYKSSKPSVASISASGMISAKKSGSTKITVTAHNGATGSFTLKVTAVPGSVKISAPRTELGVGESLQFSASIPGSRAGAYSYSSSDEGVLSIDPATGLAQAVGVGYADITVKTYNNKKASKKILVLNAPEYMQFDVQHAVIGMGDVFAARVQPNSGAGGAFSLASLDPSVADVDAVSGEIAALAAGETTITATAYNGAIGTMQLYVLPAPSVLRLKNLEADASGIYTLNLHRGESYQIEPDLGEYTVVSMEFSSSDKNVAAVSADGLITVKGSGAAGIIVRTYSGAEARILLTVEKWTERYRAKAFAHALGGIKNKTYSNSLEAFKLSYKNGFRIIEADFSYTSDGEIVLWHDWKKDQINSKTKLGYIPTAAEFAGMKIYDKYTSVSYRDLLKLMQEYTDFYLITDTKYDDAATVKKQFQQMVSIAREMDCEYVLDRFIVQIYNQKMLSVVKQIYPFRNYIFTLYNLYSKAPTTAQFKEAAAFCSKNGVDLITMPKNWWNTKYLNLMAQYNVDVAVHTVNSASEAKKFYNQGVTAIYTDFLSAKGT